MKELIVSYWKPIVEIGPSELKLWLRICMQLLSVEVSALAR